MHIFLSFSSDADSQAQPILSWLYGLRVRDPFSLVVDFIMQAEEHI